VKTPEKTALITGANKKIGFTVAKQIAASGYSVYIAYRDKDKGQDALLKLNKD
jgi:NAD(P)-dependent dehydrogenase (short-subunit alcohol dehydrogenase family)